MSSIMNKNVSQEVKVDNVIYREPTGPPPLTRKNAMFVDDEGKKKVLILTDHDDQTELLKQNSISFHPLQFSNRDLSYFENRTECIWINLTDSNARAWIRLNLGTSDEFLKVVLYKKDKYQKWVQELKDESEIDNVISLKEFKKISAFDIAELTGKLSNYTKLSKPDTCLTVGLKFLKKVIQLL